MPPPFPGMDPYIERPALWPDFHNDLAPTIRAQLNSLILPRYYAALTVYTVYEVISIGEPAGRFPGVSVATRRPGLGLMEPSMATLAPGAVPSRVAYAEPLELSRVEIRLAGEDRVVTIIEILSPANKRHGGGYEDYLEKRQEIFRSTAHLIEIDLLRAGTRPPLEDPVPTAPYYVTLSRATRRPLVEVWPIQLNQLLPVIPIPLLYPDPDSSLDLGEAVATVYERAAYAYRIDYSQPPPPPVTEDEGRWVDQLLEPIRREAS